MWAYVRGDRPSGSTTVPTVWFAYTPDRKGIDPQTHLTRFTGILQPKAYGWAHARRKFHELH